MASVDADVSVGETHTSFGFVARKSTTGKKAGKRKGKGKRRAALYV